MHANWHEKIIITGNVNGNSKQSIIDRLDNGRTVNIQSSTFKY